MTLFGVAAETVFGVSAEAAAKKPFDEILRDMDVARKAQSPHVFILKGAMEDLGDNYGEVNANVCAVPSVV